MRKIELYFENVDFEMSFKRNKIKLAEFENLEELKKNYLNYFDDDDYPKGDWQIADFDSRIKELDKIDGAIILAYNALAFKIFEAKNMSDQTNPFVQLFKNAEIPPMILCVGYCS